MLPDIKRDPISGVRPHTKQLIGHELIWTDQKGCIHTFTIDKVEDNEASEITDLASALFGSVGISKSTYSRYPTLEEVIRAWNEYTEELHNSLMERFRMDKIDD